MKTTKYTLAGVLGLIVLLTPNAVRADTVYTYTGNTLTSSTGGFSCAGCSIDGSFTVAAPLPAGTTMSVTPSSFDFFISPLGSPTWTNAADSFGAEFLITTNTSDQITGWLIALQTPVTLFPGIIICNTPADCGALPQGDVYTTAIAVFGSNDNPGTWSSVTTTPEPSSIILLGSGLLGLACAVRRKRLA